MEKFSNLPNPVKGGVAVGGGGGLIFAGVLMAKGQWLFFGVLLLFLALGLGGYFCWRAWKRKKQAARMTNEMQQLSSASPRAISDLGARARLDDLRKKFEKGVTEYRSRGKDLYTLPWYVFVGAPGSGKSEAIRHSNVGFPPGMQDEFQGVGGTINMDWWFTNQAVILDTAGRLMFEEVKPGEQSEWREFLTLLKKNRPNCPINGLFLVIPSDSLIKDSSDDISKKAGRIAQQLDLIQRVLDVRFPVYVIITKCDKINGFREFFDDLTDPQLQHQMMGWSNPDPLDTAFRAELVDQHLDKVVNRLRRRRMGVLRDPAPQSENPSARRADEVDALFALPQSLSLLAPRLRRYLEAIFVAGEWSAKPLFLRGIYFTSSMREGAALDEELAKAIGVGVDDLGDEKIWERERAYFLRDLFIDKVFRERGLVTRATNTARMLRSRQLALYGAGSAALALFVLFAWFSLGDLNKSVGTHSDTWKKVSSAGWHGNKAWKQSIVPLEGSTYADRIVTNVVVGRSDSKPIGEFHAELRQEATRRAKRGFLTFLFPGIYKDFQAESRRAQRVVFENGVVQPLIDATRQKIDRGVNNNEAMERLPEALAAVMELEGANLVRRKGGDAPALSAGDAERFLSALIRFVSGQDAPVPPKLAATMAATYADEDGAQGWPSPWLGTVGLTNRLAQHPGIQAGLNELEKYAIRNVESRMEGWKQASMLREQVVAFQKLENDLFVAARARNAQKVRQTFAALGPIATNINEQLNKITNSGLFQAGLSFTNAYLQFQSVVLSRADEPVVKVRAAHRKALSRMTNQFLLEVDARLDQAQKAVRAKVTQAQQAEDVQVLAGLDRDYLVDRRYSSRWDIYRAAYEASLEKPFDDLIGGRGELLQQRLDAHKRHREKTAEYKGPLLEPVQKTLEFAWEAADTAQRESFRYAYLLAATNRLKPNLWFPLCADMSRSLDAKSLEEVSRELDKMTKDLRAQPLQDPAISNQDWMGFSNRVARFHALASALLDVNLKPVICVVSLAPEEQKEPDHWRTRWRWISISGTDAQQNPIRTGNASFAKLAELGIDRSISFVLKDNGDGRFEVPVDGQWGPIKLLFRASGERNGNSWLLRLPTGKDGDAAGAITLKLDFGAPLPDPKEWCKPL
jgi:hypothetical protein